MPSRKQRRRREKSRRHEYEYVLVDETGEEVEAEAPVARKTTAKTAKRNGAGPAVQRRAGRTVQPPSWRRVGKRGLIFAPVMFIVVSLIGGKSLNVPQRIAETVFLLAFFLPFSYVMDTITYRMYRKRVERN